MKPAIETVRTKIRGVAARWLEAYGPNKHRAGWYTSQRHDDDREVKYRQLLALDPETATETDVAQIIGNDSWTRPSSCDACERRDMNAVVTIGQEPDYESRTASLCYACVLEALEAFDCHEHEDCAKDPTTLGRACVVKGRHQSGRTKKASPSGDVQHAGQRQSPAHDEGNG